jgi:hypothetical protein
MGEVIRLHSDVKDRFHPKHWSLNLSLFVEDQNGPGI